MEKINEDKNNYKKINIIKDSILISPLINKDILPNKTLLISKIKSPRDMIQKIDNKSQTSSNFLFHTIHSRNNNKMNNINYIKEAFTNNSNITNNKNLFIHTIQLDKNNLRLISTRNINNIKIQTLDNNKNNSEVFHSQHMSNKKSRVDIVKYRFLQSQKNYYKRVTNLKDINIFQKNINNFKVNLNEFKKNKSINKINYYYLLLKNNNNKQINKKDNKKESSFPSIHNQNLKTDKKTIKLNKNNSNVQIKLKNKIKSIKDDFIKKKKLYKNVNNKLNFLTHRINNHYDNKKQNEEENSTNIKNKNKNKNKVNTSLEHESKKIINDNYNIYLNNISSSDSNKSNNNKNLFNSVNKKLINQILTKKMKHRIINIKNGIFNLNKNKLNISIQDNKDDKNNEKLQNNFFQENNIKSIIKIKKLTIDNNSHPEINKNIIFNPFLRQKLFHEY